MPLLSRLYVKTALVYLAAALLTGAVMALRAPAAFAASTGPLWHVYLHLFLVGWLTQLIFGVAYWLFPRHSRERPYGTTWPAQWAYPLLNAGLILRAFAEPGVARTLATAWRWSLVASATLQWLAVLLFAVYLWPRVKIK